MEKIINKLGLLILMLFAIGSGAFLFFEDNISTYADLLGFHKPVKVLQYVSDQPLRIAYLFKPADLNPFSGDPAVQSRLIDVYEGLVQVDRDLNIKPALAVSYGLINDKQWYFQLRHGVKFHNGTQLKSDDVIYSFDAAQGQKDNGLGDLLSGIDKIEKVDDFAFNLSTKEADPLLLNKLSKLNIIPKDFTDFANPIGTGVYKIKDAADLGKITFERNDQYWDELPYFKAVEVQAMPVKSERIDALVNGDVDLLVNVPPDAVQQMLDAGLKTAQMPSLEVGFLMFNFTDQNFQNKDLRLAVADSINKSSFLDLAKGFAKTVNQFVSNGVFGYNPDLQDIAFNPEAAKQLVSKSVSGFEKLKITFYYPQSLKLLGKYIQDQLVQVGIEVDGQALSDADLQTKLQAGDLAFYYLGWRSDLGDALPFLKSVVHTKDQAGNGLYNGINYSNAEVDALIERSEHNLILADRLKDMQKAMKIVVQDDIIGVPLFETQSLFAFNKNLNFVPRVDSLVYPSSISLINQK